MIQEKDINLIIRFFDLALSYEELEAFEQRILHDLEFREKFEVYKEANTTVNNSYKDTEKQARTQKWKELLNTKQSTKSLKKFPWKWFCGIAVGFVLTFFIWQTNYISQKPDLNKLIANAWDKKIGLDFNTIRSTYKDSLKNKISSAYNAYNDMDYQSTINQLSNFKTGTLYYEDILLIRALSNYKNNKVDVAFKILDTLSKYPTGRKSEVAKWYIGLIYLEQGNMEDANRFLKLPDDKEKELRLLE